MTDAELVKLGDEIVQNYFWSLSEALTRNRWFALKQREADLIRLELPDDGQVRELERVRGRLQLMQEVHEDAYIWVVEWASRFYSRYLKDTCAT